MPTDPEAWLDFRASERLRPAPPACAGCGGPAECEVVLDSPQQQPVQRLCSCNCHAKWSEPEVTEADVATHFGCAPRTVVMLTSRGHWLPDLIAMTSTDFWVLVCRTNTQGQARLMAALDEFHRLHREAPPG